MQSYDGAEPARFVVAQALRSVEARLNLLAARAGLSYTLTTHSHERAVRVTASHGVTLVAQRPLPDPCAPNPPVNSAVDSVIYSQAAVDEYSALRFVLKPELRLRLIFQGRLCHYR